MKTTGTQSFRGRARSSNTQKIHPSTPSFKNKRTRQTGRDLTVLATRRTETSLDSRKGRRDNGPKSHSRGRGGRNRNRQPGQTSLIQHIPKVSSWGRQSALAPRLHPPPAPPHPLAHTRHATVQAFSYAPYPLHSIALTPPRIPQSPRPLHTYPSCHSLTPHRAPHFELPPLYLSPPALTALCYQYAHAATHSHSSTLGSPPFIEYAMYQNIPRSMCS
jgi:hypothetical protein